MKSKHSTSLIFVNLFWLALFAVGGVVAYMYGNFEGIGNEDVGKTYVQKTTINFKDLPADVKKNYIHRKELPMFKKYTALEESSNPSTPFNDNELIAGSEDELKAQIITLRQKNSFLYQDNLDLANKNWDLALQLRDEKQILEHEREKMLSKNLEMLNEAEQQHYLNINDLTKRINELQQDAIAASKVHETKVVGLENKIDELERQLRNNELKVDDEVSAATKEQRISNSTLAEKNRYLLEQQRTLKEKMSKRLDDLDNKLLAKKEEIERLKRLINEKESEKNRVLTEHTKEIIAIEKKNNATIQALRKDMSSVKNQHRQELVQKNAELDKIIQEHEKKRRELREKIVLLEGDVKGVKVTTTEIKETHKEELEALKKNIIALEKERDSKDKKIKEVEEKALAMLGAKDKEYTAYLEELKAKSIGLQGKEDEIIKKLKKELNSSKEVAASVEGLKQQLETQAKKHEEELMANEAKHAKNYELLNEKIVALEQDKKHIIKQAKEKFQNNESEEALKAKEKENKSLKTKIATLNVRLDSLKEENEHLAKSGNDQLISLKKSFDALKEDVRTRESAYETKIANLSKKLENEKKKEEKVVSKKLLASIECDDMPSGTNQPTSTCKQKVNSFLAEYGSRNFYEVLPIIDDGGFSTLKKVEKDKRLKIPKKEIARLTRLSNIGLGKDRAVSGGELIEAAFGDETLISYSPQSVIREKKRGFVIRVYE